MGLKKGETYPAIINNFIFPDDLVGTVGNTATDPFADRRDAFGKIYSNFNFTLNLDEGRNYGSEKFSIEESCPEAVITLDFSENKWNYSHSKMVSIVINNSARLVGGGGAGGHGVRDHSTTSKQGDVSEGGFGGGGGGAGAGTGRNDDHHTSYANSNYFGWQGTGLPGSGWPHEDPALATASKSKFAQDGTRGSRWDVGGSGGAKAAVESSENISTSLHIAHTSYYGNGSDGGDVFKVIHPAGILPFITINNSNTGIIVGGGGGGAGGYEVDGGSGGSSGGHGQGTFGPTAFTGGNPGYIVSSVNDTYTRPVNIINSGNGIVHGRNPDIPSHDTSNTSGGIAGGWYITGNASSFYRGKITSNTTTDPSANTTDPSSNDYVAVITSD